MLMMRSVCHFDGGEISTRSSTKIGFSLRSFLRRFLLRRNDKTDENILMETSALAQIEVKSPELKKLIFLARKQRPTEARFMA